MGVDDIRAEYHALVLSGSSPWLQVKLLKYIDPDPIPDPNISILRRLGFNHICFAVADLERELETITANGFKTRNEVMEFNDRKLVFLNGPEGITVELAEKHDG